MGSREAVLSSRCRDVVVGTILGDGCLERNGRNVRLRIDHSVRQRALVEWKLTELSELTPSTPRLVRRRDARTGQVHENYRFATCTTSRLNEFFDLFYPKNRRKRIPSCIDDILISPVAVAVWYMDDGGRRGDCRSGYLNTNAYAVDDVGLLKQCLERRLGITTSTHFAAGKPRIYIPQSQFLRFCDIIRPHVISEMNYKLL